MQLTFRDIEELLRLFADSPYNELSLEAGEVKLLVRKDAGRKDAGRSVGETAGAEIAATAAERASSPAPGAGTGAGTRADAEPRAGEMFVRAPVMGTFYRAPSPDAPPFRSEGDRVEPGDTVCLIEVMKLFTSVPAGIAGTVTRVLAENGAPVEMGQPLFAIRPDGR